MPSNEHEMRRTLAGGAPSRTASSASSVHLGAGDENRTRHAVDGNHGPTPVGHLHGAGDGNRTRLVGLEDRSFALNNTRIRAHVGNRTRGRSIPRTDASKARGHWWTSRESNPEPTTCKVVVHPDAQARGGVGGNCTRIPALPAQCLACWTTTPLVDLPRIALGPVACEAAVQPSAQARWHARKESNPRPRFWKPRCAPALGRMAGPTGFEPATSRLDKAAG